MATVQSPYRSGGLFGFHYLFEQAGDGLRKHVHTDETAHNVIVLLGSVAVNITGEPSKILRQGNVFDFDWTREHYLVALEPNSLVLSLMLFGIPAGYKDLPETELHGVFNVNV